MNWLLLSTFVAAWMVWTGISIIRNFAIARKIGFPVVISPVTPLNPFWILTYRSFPSVLQFFKHLPFGLGTWAKCTYMGWSFDDKHALHDEYGSIFTVVTPGGCEVTVADPEAAHAVFARRKEFIKPAVMYDQLNVFGRNLDTVEGKDWERHRRLTAPSFNEKTSAAVWKEALRQTRDMASIWLEKGTQGTVETVADTATLALHVLTCVGFGIVYPYRGGVRDLPNDHAMTYRDALLLCLQNMITFAIFPKRFLSFSFLPKKLRTLGVAVHEFQNYMEEMLLHERSEAERRGESGSNLMGILVRSSDELREAEKKGGSNGITGLTNEEIFGNIFVFNLAGHETTANTIAAALVLLAANPEYQRWISEEIDNVFKFSNDYENAFPQLKRCLAVMYETLRLYGSIVFIPKSTGFHRQTIDLNGKTHVLPSGTSVNINVEALHTNQQTWGSDALSWKPDRWVRPSIPEELSTPSRDSSETFIEPTPGSFVPWADGPRVCVGRKFSQVEFVAVIASLFRSFTVRPALKENGREALMSMVDSMAITYVTLQMTRPKDVALIWEKR